MQKLRTNRTLRLSKNLSSMTVTVRMLQKVSYTTQCVSYTSIFLNSIQIVAVVNNLDLLHRWMVNSLMPTKVVCPEICSPGCGSTRC